jgi:hypothetical protein
MSKSSNNNKSTAGVDCVQETETVGVDIPKESSAETSRFLSPRQLGGLISDKMEIDDEKHHNRTAFHIFVIIGIFLILLIAASVVLHVLNIAELKVLENCIVFAQGAITTVLGYLFGTKAYRKK